MIKFYVCISAILGADSAYIGVTTIGSTSTGATCVGGSMKKTSSKIQSVLQGERS